MKKRYVSLFLTGCLVAAMTTTVIAKDEDTAEDQVTA